MADELDVVRSLRLHAEDPRPPALGRAKESLVTHIADVGDRTLDRLAGAGRTLTVVGAGLGGLLTAIEARRRGLEVEVHEARPSVGGRGRSTGGPYVANWGPHALYADGPLWDWLDEHDVLPETVEWAPEAGVVFRRGGAAGPVPMQAFEAVPRLALSGPAPAGRSFREWATEHVGADAAEQLRGMAGVFSFHHDPGSLAAEFVFDRLARITALPPSARFVVGGWQRLVDLLHARAVELGVTVRTSSPVESLPDGPVVQAVPLRVASRLLGDPSLMWTGSRAVLVDVALEAHPDDPYAIWDVDEAGWAETYTHRDPSLAPPGEHLVQAQLGLRPDEDLDAGVARVERLLDVGFPSWRERVTWRRRARIADETGAVDLPGTSWRDRPDPDRGGGVFVVGDMVAAPGLLSEVILGSAQRAVERVEALVA